MPSADTSASNYMLGYSDHEHERLMPQARVLRPYTDRFFRAAGLQPGMKVLDIGSGMGDVSLLAADIVGPGGKVLGIDRDPIGIERATQRARHQGCGSWTSFQQSNLDEFSTEETFDALVGRFILLYQPDPAATIKRLSRFIKPGGIIVFHEMDFTFTAKPSFPPCAPYDQSCYLIAETTSRLGVPTGMGCRLGKAFVDADLPFPCMASETPVGGGAGSNLFSWIANTAISLSPRFAAVGLTAPEGLPLDASLAEKIEQCAIEQGSQLIGPQQFAAWTRKPHSN
jgi:SAM-dependent methyltransferase